jgi:hypothetical protein
MIMKIVCITYMEAAINLCPFSILLLGQYDDI